MATLTDNRIAPLASIAVYDPGQGDARLTDRGWHWYDIVSATYQQGRISEDGDGRPLLQVIPDVGMVCSPYVRLRDTLVTHFARTGGVWEERKPSQAQGEVLRLCQVSAEADKYWEARSLFTLPSNPCFVISLSVGDTAAKQSKDVAAYVAVYFGQGWRVSLTSNSGVKVHYRGKECGSVGVEQTADRKEIWLFVRVHRGRVLISGDFGKSYAAFQTPERSGEPAPVDYLYLQGCGKTAVFGLHEMAFQAGSYTSPKKRTNKRRDKVADLTPYCYEPEGAKVTMGYPYGWPNTDSGTASSTDMTQYVASLVPAQAWTAGNLVFWRSPELYAVLTEVAPKAVSGSGAYTTPFDDAIESITIDKPYELHQATATIMARLPFFSFDESWRWRRIAIRLGEQHTDGVAWVQVFTGYVEDIAVKETEAGSVLVTVKACSGAIRAQRKRWDSTRPLGGMPANEALDLCLKEVGLTTEYRQWDAAGEKVRLEFGAYERPNWWPQSGTPVWETMQEIARVIGCEIGVTDAGIWATVPYGYYDSAVTAIWEALPGSRLLDAIREVEQHHNSSEYFTGVVIKGQDKDGNPIEARAETTDTTALDSPRYCPWDELEITVESGNSTREALAAQVEGRWQEVIPMRFTPMLTGEGRLGLNRRQRVRVIGTRAGIRDSEEYALFTLRHTWQPTFDQVRTEVGLRRVE